MMPFRSARDSLTLGTPDSRSGSVPPSAASSSSEYLQLQLLYRSSQSAARCSHLSLSSSSSSVRPADLPGSISVDDLPGTSTGTGTHVGKKQSTTDKLLKKFTNRGADATEQYSSPPRQNFKRLSAHIPQASVPSPLQPQAEYPYPPGNNFYPLRSRDLHSSDSDAGPYSSDNVPPIYSQHRRTFPSQQHRQQYRQQQQPPPPNATVSRNPSSHDLLVPDSSAHSQAAQIAPTPQDFPVPQTRTPQQPVPMPTGPPHPAALSPSRPTQENSTSVSDKGMRDQAGPPQQQAQQAQPQVQPQPPSQQTQLPKIMNTLPPLPPNSGSNTNFRSGSIVDRHFDPPTDVAGRSSPQPPSSDRGEDAEKAFKDICERATPPPPRT